MIAEILATVDGRLLEGPCWEAGGGRLLFVDILGHELLALDWNSGVLARRVVGETPSAWIPRAQGGHAIASRYGLRLAGDELDTLAITTAAGDGGGHVFAFAVDAGVRGLPVADFAG